MSKQSSVDPEEKGARGNSKQAQLLVLLLLLASFGYLYFFTGLIKPHQEAAKSPEQPALMKKPMPPRAEQKPLTVGAEQTEQTPAATAKASPSAQNAALPEPAPSPVPARPEPVKAAKNQEPAAQNEQIKTVKNQETTEQKGSVKQGAIGAEKEGQGKVAQSKATQSKAIQSKATQAAAPVKPSAKNAPAATKPQSAGTKGTEAFSLKIGEFPLDKDVAVAEEKLKKARITPIIRQKMTRMEPMHRLFYAEHSARESAAADLEQLRAKAPDAFVLKENDKFVVYAGSYFKEDRGTIEQARLFDKGIRLVIKKSKVKIPVTQLSAGNFASQKEAGTAAAKLKKIGLNATVIKAVRKTSKK